MSKNSKSKLSQIVLALVVGTNAVFFAACGADESKAPQITLSNGTLYATSRDDNTILEGVTVSGRNGKCKKQLAFATSTNIITLDEIFYSYENMETCKADGHKDCKPLFDGQKIAYGDAFGFYIIDSKECPPKNGAYTIELDTNFGTYKYEIKEP